MAISILFIVRYNASMNSFSSLFVIALAMVFSLPGFAATKWVVPDYSELCDTDLSQIFFYGLNTPSTNDKLKMFVWNTKKFENTVAFRDLKTHAENSDIVFIQEAAHSRNFQTAMIQALPEHRHSFYPSFCDDSKFVYGVQISTKLNSNQEELWPSPDTEPFSSIRKMSGYSQIEWNGIQIHLINTHALNFNPGGKFKEQINDLYEKIRKLDGPIIWAGDFNTWVPMRRKYLLETADALGLKHAIPDNDNRKLKLDHVFYRGLDLKSAKIIPLTTSDHFAISVEFTKHPDHKTLAQF